MTKATVILIKIRQNHASFFAFGIIAGLGVTSHAEVRKEITQFILNLSFDLSTLFFFCSGLLFFLLLSSSVFFGLFLAFSLLLAFKLFYFSSFFLSELLLFKSLFLCLLCRSLLPALLNLFLSAILDLVKVF